MLKFLKVADYLLRQVRRVQVSQQLAYKFMNEYSLQYRCMQ